MPFYPADPCPGFQRTLAPFLTDDGLSFAEVLSATEVEEAFTAAGADFGTSPGAVFTPAVTLWAFLSQVVCLDKSCRAAVARVLALLLALERGPCSEDTAAYCRARAKLPTVVVRRLALRVGCRLEQAVPQAWLWKGQHVQLVDGTALALPDTPENQQAYPQPPGQKPGVGYPLIRVVLLLSLATAACLGVAYGRYEGKGTGETALLRQLLDEMEVIDILVADRDYCTYWLVALARARGKQVVFRMHHRRHYDFRKGQRLGKADHVVVWARPPRPAWMDAATYATIPETLTVRELRVQVAVQGCRTGELVIVTTLTDAVAYPRADVADLYHKRWHVELDIRAIKQSLQLDHLRCQTPAMVEKELWVHLLGYNLIRKVSNQAAQEAGVQPRDVSLTATRQTLAAAWSQLSQAPADERVRQGRALLTQVAKERVADRPDRCEPRAKKQRPKQYARLTVPRAQARAALMGGKRSRRKMTKRKKR
jgi:DDE family transposase